MQWQRDNVVFAVAYYDVPGLETVDPVLAVARLVDAAYTQNPLTAQKAEKKP
jgi:hypothetical protein